MAIQDQENSEVFRFGRVNDTQLGFNENKTERREEKYLTYIPDKWKYLK